MSFSKTISTFAALASIFGASVAGWKLAESQRDVPSSALDQKIMELEKKLEEPKQQPITSISVPTTPSQIITHQVAPPTSVIEPPPVPPEQPSTVEQ